MNNTLNFQRQNPLQTMTGLSRSLALPHEYQPVRLPSFPALERTAVMAFNKPVNYALPATSSRVMLTRQAAYPLWADQSVPYLAVSQYGFVTFDANADFTLPLSLAGSKPGLYSAGSNLTVNCSPLPSNAFPVIGTDSGTTSCQWTYAPAGSKITTFLLAGSSLAGVLGLLVKYDLWISPGETSSYVDQFGVSPSFTGTQAYTTNPISKNCWIRPNGVSCTIPPTAGNTTVALTFAITCNYTVAATIVPAVLTLTPLTPLVPVFVPLAYPTEFTFSPIPWQSTRLTAVAALFTNVSQVLTKQGTVLCARLNPDTIDVWNAGVQDLSSVNPAEKQFLGLEHGAYTYAPPSTDLSHFWDYATAATQTLPLYRLDNDSLVNVMIFDDPSVATSPCSLAVNLDWHIEFRTVSTLWQVGLSTATLESLHQSQLALVASGFFFNNEDHKANIRTIINSITKYLGPIASAVHPIAGMLVNKVHDLTIPSRPTAPRPTTLQISSQRSRSASVGSRRSRSGSRVRIMTKAQRKRLRKKQAA